MGTIKNNTLDILKNGANCFGLEQSFDSNIFSRYRNFILNVSKSKDYKHEKICFVLRFFQFIFPLIAALLAKYMPISDYHILTWIFIIIIWCFLFFIEYFFPKDIDKLYDQIKYFKVLSLSERLASQVALYSTTIKLMQDKDDDLIAKISKFTANVFHGDLLKDLENKSKIVSNNGKHNNDLEQTRIFIRDEIFNSQQVDKIVTVAGDINDAASSIFFGSNFSTKIYLLTENKILLSGQEQNLKLLTSIHKHTFNLQKDNRGSSWIPCDGKQAEVWNCLNQGSYFVKKNLGGYKGKIYPSALFICLPGKIGVITIAADSEFAYDNMISDDVVKTLGIASRDLILKAIDINE